MISTCFSWIVQALQSVWFWFIGIFNNVGIDIVSYFVALFLGLGVLSFMLNRFTSDYRSINRSKGSYSKSKSGGVDKKND